MYIKCTSHVNQMYIKCTSHVNQMYITCTSHVFFGQETETRSGCITVEFNIFGVQFSVKRTVILFNFDVSNTEKHPDGCPVNDGLYHV